MKPALLFLPWGVRTFSIWPLFILSSPPPPMPLHPSIAGPPGFACAGPSIFLIFSSFYLPQTSSNIPSGVIPGFTPPQNTTMPALSLPEFLITASQLFMPHGISSGQGRVCCRLHIICTQTHPQLSPAGLTSLTTPESRLDRLPPSAASLPVTAWIAKKTDACSREGAERCLLVLLSCIRFQSHHYLGTKVVLGGTLERERRIPVI